MVTGARNQLRGCRKRLAVTTVVSGLASAPSGKGRDGKRRQQRSFLIIVKHPQYKKDVPQASSIVRDDENQMRR
ncbi:hypothetical protein KCP74_03785 [Salmonella enterica subsp. enterica]|nr:hypothetical protein KCP74_03785 [Salmonella enterica subsp. enterica]